VILFCFISSEPAVNKLFAYHSAVTRQPRTSRSGGGPTIRKGPTIYIVFEILSKCGVCDCVFTECV